KAVPQTSTRSGSDRFRFSPARKARGTRTNLPHRTRPQRCQPRQREVLSRPRLRRRPSPRATGAFRPSSVWQYPQLRQRRLSDAVRRPYEGREDGAAHGEREQQVDKRVLCDHNGGQEEDKRQDTEETFAPTRRFHHVTLLPAYDATATARERQRSV